MEELVLPSLPVLTAVADAQIDVPAGSDALRGLLMLHQSRNKPEGPLATRAAVIRSVCREPPSCFTAIRNHERICQEVAAAALLGHELVGSTPRVVRPAARRALAALEVQRSARQVTVHSIATGASEVPRLVRPLVLLQCIGVAKALSALIASHRIETSHALLAPAQALALAPLRRRKLGPSTDLAALAAPPGHTARHGRRAAGAGQRNPQSYRQVNSREIL